jgi:glycosidase
MLAEGHEPELHEHGFDMTYAWNLKDAMNNYAKGKAVLADIKDHFYTVEKEYPENAFIMNFTTNHDENSWDGTVYERLGKLALPFSVLISTAPGMPLVYSGQEAGLNKRLEFFEKDPIQWTDHIQGTIFKKIFNEKINNRALWNGKEGGKINFLENKGNQNVLAFYREKEKNKVLVLINLSDTESKFFIEDENAFDEYKDLFRDTEISITHKTELSIEPYDFIVLIK